MPFSSTTGQLFDEAIINDIPDFARGVYGIFRAGDSNYIYIGKGNLKERLLCHLYGNDDNPCIKKHGPTHFVIEVLTGDPTAREQALIAEFSPPCNRVGVIPVRK